jgi:hypothetical protein
VRSVINASSCEVRGRGRATQRAEQSRLGVGPPISMESSLGKSAESPHSPIGTGPLWNPEEKRMCGSVAVLPMMALTNRHAAARMVLVILLK